MPRSRYGAEATTSGPPPWKPRTPGHPKLDPRYSGIAAERLPSTECLKDTVDRFLPAWRDRIAPEIGAGKRVLITAHGNSLRALVKYLDGVSDQDIVELNIPTGIPLVYDLDDGLKPIRHYYLGDESKIEEAARAVAGQASAKAPR